MVNNVLAIGETEPAVAFQMFNVVSGLVVPIPTLPSPWINKEVVCPDPPGDFLKFNEPLSKMSKVWAVAFPLKLRFADKDAEPVTSRAARGVVLPMPTLPSAAILTFSALAGLKVIIPSDCGEFSTRLFKPAGMPIQALCVSLYPLKDNCIKLVPLSTFLLKIKPLVVASVSSLMCNFPVGLVVPMPTLP